MQTFAGVPWMILNKVILFFVYFGISVVVVRLLDPEEYGIFSLCKNFTEYLVVFCSLGMTPMLTRFIPELTENTNKAGLKRLLWRALVLQCLAVIAVAFLLAWLTPQFNRWFNVDFRNYLFLTGILIGVLVFKNYLVETFTALFKIKTVAMLSFLFAVLWFALLYMGLTLSPEVDTAIIMQIAAGIAVYGVGGLMLIRHIAGLNWRSPPFGIGKRRVLKFSGSIWLNDLTRMLMLKYTEVFFLGVTAASPAIVGDYELGSGLPILVIFFIPTAMQGLFTAGFSQAYVRDPHCLERLIKSYYKMLILFTVPLGLFGLFFAPRGIVLIYGEEMEMAGPIAAAFCIVNLLPLISLPLSMAIKAKEKVINMLPLLILQISVNLVLDYLLIVTLDLGVWGGVGAVFGTFILTIPIRLRVVKKIVGGIYFPIGYTLRITLAFLVLTAALSPLSAYLNLPGFLVLGFVYVLFTPFFIRLLRLVRDEDVRDFRDLDDKRINFILRILTR